MRAGRNDGQGRTTAADDGRIGKRAMRSAVRTSLMALAFCQIVAAQAADTPAGARGEPTVEVEGSTLEYTGLLNTAGLEQLRRILKQQPSLRELRINSSGGDALPAIEIGELVRDRRLEVVVDDRCNSACANYVFVPATKKTITAGSMVMWHNACPQNIPTDIKFTDMVQGGLDNVGAAIRVDGQEPDAEEAARVMKKQSRRLNREMARYFSRYAERHLAFFSDTQVDSRIVCLGDYIDLPKGKGYAYTMSVEDMGMFGVCNVVADGNYLEQAVDALARASKSDRGGIIRMSDYPDFQPGSAKAGCADAQPASLPTIER